MVGLMFTSVVPCNLFLGVGLLPAKLGSGLFMKQWVVLAPCWNVMISSVGWQGVVQQHRLNQIACGHKLCVW